VIAIVGGGIVGLATAYALRDLRPVVFEKEREVGLHQTGHNSGVIHSGIYYKPGSFKARLSVEGGRLLREFCRDQAIRTEACGKVVVATDPSELPRLEELLLPESELKQIWRLRREVANHKALDAMEGLLKQLEKTKTNEEFLKSMG